MLTTPIRNKQPSLVTRQPKDTLRKDTLQSLSEPESYVARPKHRHEALPSTDDLWQRPLYRLGDGDHTAQVLRSGSMRAYALPSRGIRT